VIGIEQAFPIDARVMLSAKGRMIFNRSKDKVGTVKGWTRDGCVAVAWDSRPRSRVDPVPPAFLALEESDANPD